jgi:hypothetical protein
VNNNDHYERRDDRVVPDHASRQPQTDQVVSALAHHRDPSVPPTPDAPAPTAERGVAWVRPSELPTLIGSKWAARGIDLQGALVRRSRRAPGKAARAGHKITRSAIARPESATPTVSPTEELGL